MRPTILSTKVQAPHVFEMSSVQKKHDTIAIYDELSSAGARDSTRAYPLGAPTFCAFRGLWAARLGHGPVVEAGT